MPPMKIVKVRQAILGTEHVSRRSSTHRRTYLRDTLFQERDSKHSILNTHGHEFCGISTNTGKFNTVLSCQPKAPQ